MERRLPWPRPALGVVAMLGLALAGCTAKSPAPASGEPAPADSDDPPATAELVEPATRDAYRWGEARANDGAPFGFALRLSPTGSKEWVVYLQGGGFCDDQAVSCATRSGAHITSPPGDDGAAIALPTGGVFSTDPRLNHRSATPTWCSRSTRRVTPGAARPPPPVPSRAAVRTGSSAAGPTCAPRSKS